MKRLLWISVCWVLLPMRCAALDVLVNQTGYEPNAPKTVRTQRASDYAGDGTFSVRRVSDNAEVYSGALVRKGGLWSKFYWAGDFSAFKTTGDYYVYATVNAESGTSYDFSIGPGVLLNKTGTLVYQYFTAQRCGTSVSLQYTNRYGNLVTWSHNTCHTDDGYMYPSGPYCDTAGGCHDSGEYQKYSQGFGGNPVFDLLHLYDSNRSHYDAIDTDSNGIADILDEALWQARWLVKMVQANGHVVRQITKRRPGASWVRPENDTDRIIGTSDDRWVEIGDEVTPQETVVCASLIRMHRVLASKGLPTENFAQKALDIWNHRVALAISEGGHNNLGSAPHHIWAGLDLYAVFGQQDCWDRSIQRVDEMANSIIANPACYDETAETAGYELGALAWFVRSYPTNPKAALAQTAVQALMSHNIALADNPIGLIRRDEGGSLIYFPANPSLGLNRLYGTIAWAAIESYRIIGDQAYLRFALDQFDWILGANYFRVCMMEAAGDYYVNKYHTRYDTFVTNGIEPGVVPNGYIRDAAGLPWMDFGTDSVSAQTNEGWLPNNSAFAMGLAAMSIFSDTTPPGPVTSFTATPGDGQISLAWHNPSDSDFAATTIRVSTTGYPAGPTDGTLVVDKMGSPNSNDNHVHTGLANGTTYYYSAFARDMSLNYASAAHASGTPVDTTPPGPVSGFLATPGSGQVSLSWTNPTNPDFIGTRIRYKTTGYPTSPTDGTLVIDKANSPGSGDSYNHTGLVNGTTYYYSAFAHDAVPNYAAAVNARATPSASGTCFSESFPYANGNLNGNGGWSGSATTQIIVENETAKIIGGSTSYDAIQTLSPPCTGDGTIAAVEAKIKRGSGTSTMWSVYIDDTASANLARWYGTGTTARGRIGGSSIQVTPPQTLTGGWDVLYVKINFATNQSTFLFNGANIGTLDHSEFGAGDLIGRIRFERIDYAPAAGNQVYLDDIAVGLVDAVAPTCAVGPPSVVATRTGPVSFGVSFSEPVFGFSSSSDVQVNAVGTAAAGTVGITGSGAGPYTVTLSNITGSGTLGITAKSASCADKAGNANTSSSASPTVRVIPQDGSIAVLRTLPNGQLVEIGNKALYLKQAGFAYIEEPDRWSGIRLQGSITPNVGDLVCLTGQINTTAGGERYILVDLISACGSFSIDPFGTSNFGLLDDLLTGMYVKCWGKVKPGSITSNSYVLTDGSDATGIKVMTVSAPGVAENEFVTPDGAAGSDTGGRVLYKR